MATANGIGDFTTLQKVGLGVFVLGNIFASEEMVPGWGFHLGLPHALLYAIAIGSGAAGGAMIAGRYVLPGLAGGSIAGLGALWAVAAYLAAVDVSHSAISFLCAAGGALPGIGIGFGLRFVQDKLAGSAPRPT
jgi:hypothetical protein